MYLSINMGHEFEQGVNACCSNGFGTRSSIILLISRDRHFVDGLFNAFSLWSDKQYFDRRKLHSGECGLHSR